MWNLHVNSEFPQKRKMSIMTNIVIAAADNTTTTTSTTTAAAAAGL